MSVHAHQSWRSPRQIAKLILGALILGVLLWLGRSVGEFETLRMVIGSYGYVGIFFLAFLAGFNIAVPVPAVSFVPLFVASGLDFWTVVLIVGLGTTTADLVSFYLGRAGRSIFATPHTKMFVRIEHLEHRDHRAPVLALFLFASLVPFPNEIIAFPLGFLGYRAMPIVTALLCGNTLFNILFASGLIKIISI